MNKFAQDDRKGRKKALKYLQKEFPEFTFEEMPGEFDAWDIEVTNWERGSILIETKDRSYTSTAFADFMAEAGKINECKKELLQRKAEYGEEVLLLYVNTFTDGVCMVWNVIDLLKKNKYRREITRCPRTTSVYKGWKNKDCVYFKPEDALLTIKL